MSVSARNRKQASQRNGDPMQADTGKLAAATSAMDRKGPRWWMSPLFGYLAAFLLIYAPALVVPYGYADDYYYLGRALRGTLSSPLTAQVEWGRPTLALLLDVAYSLMRDVGDLRYLRLAGVLGVALLAWLLYRALLTAGLDRLQALLAPLFICAMPSFQVYVAWAIDAVALYAAALSGAALLIADRALDRWQTRQRPRRWQPLVLGLGAIGLFVLGLTLYQPTAMLFWVFAAICLFVVERSLVATARRFAAYLILAAVPLAVEYLLTKLLQLQFPYYPGIVNRTQVVRDPVGKALWVVRIPLVNALNLSNLAANVTTAAVVAAFILIGLLLYFRGTLWARLGKLGIALALIPLSHAPSVLAAVNQNSYRTMPGLSALLALYACLAWFGYLRGWREQWGREGGRRIATAGLAVAAAASAALAGVNVAREFVIPQYIEYQYVVGQLRAAVRTPATSIYFVPACRCDSIAPLLVYDEFGVPSTSHTEVTKFLVYDILQEIAPSKAHLRFILASPSQPASNYPSGYVIDMRKLRSLQNQPLAIPFPW